MPGTRNPVYAFGVPSGRIRLFLPIISVLAHFQKTVHAVFLFICHE